MLCEAHITIHCGGLNLGANDVEAAQFVEHGHHVRGPAGTSVHQSISRDESIPFGDRVQPISDSVVKLQ